MRRRSILIFLTAMITLLMVTTAPASAYTIQPWSGCGASFNSGNYDGYGNLYVTCGDPGVINIYNSSGKRIANVWTGLRVRDVAPNKAGNSMYLATIQGILKFKRTGGTNTWRKDTTWHAANYPLWDSSLKPYGWAIDVDQNENIYLADGMWSPNEVQTVVKYNSAGKFITRFGIWGNTWDLGFFYWGLSGLDVSPDGYSVLTTEAGNNRIQRWVRQADGSYRAVSYLGSDATTNPDRGGSCDFNNWIHSLAAPYDVARDASGKVYVLNTTCAQILIFNSAMDTMLGNINLTDPGQTVSRPHGFAVSPTGVMLVGQAGKMIIPDGVNMSYGPPTSKAVAPATKVMVKFKRPAYRAGKMTFSARCDFCKSTRVFMQVKKGSLVLNKKGFSVNSAWASRQLSFNRHGAKRVQVLVIYRPTSTATIKRTYTVTL